MSFFSSQCFKKIKNVGIHAKNIAQLGVQSPAFLFFVGARESQAQATSHNPKLWMIQC